jgi:hypothetical protein
MQRDLPLPVERDLPLPVDGVSATAPPIAPSDRLAAVLVRIHPRLAASLRQDVEALRHLPFPARLVGLVPVLIALATFVVFGVLRTGIYEIYSESLLFLILAVAVGGLSPTVGAALAIGIGAADLTYAVPTLFADLRRLALTDTASQLTVVTGTLGRLVAYLALWILIVEVPLLAREAPRNPQLQWLRARVHKLIVPAAVGLAAGVLTLFWVLAFPLVIRAPYVWSTATSPNSAAVAPVQSHGAPLVIVAIAASAVAALFHQRAGVDQLETPIERPRHRFAWIVPRIVALLLLGAVISGWIDLLMLALALFGSPFLARAVWSIRLVSEGLERIPAIVRLLLGFGLTVLIGQRIAESTFFDPNGYLVTMYGGGPTVFFPIAATIAVGIVLYDLLLGPPTGLRPQRIRTASVAAAAIAIPLVALALFLMLPEVAFAHDCADPGDCFSDPIALAAAAAAAAAAARRLQSHGPPPFSPGPPAPYTWDDYRKYPMVRFLYKKQLSQNRYVPTHYLTGKGDPKAKVFATSGTGTKA